MRETLEAIRVLGFWTTLWYRTGYRPFMRWAHRRNWHYMPPLYLHDDTQLWCKWCGARYTLPNPGKSAYDLTVRPNADG